MFYRSSYRHLSPWRAVRFRDEEVVDACPSRGSLVGTRTRTLVIIVVCFAKVRKMFRVSTRELFMHRSDLAASSD